MRRSSARLVNSNAQTSLRVANVGTTHQNGSPLLADDLHAELAGLTRSEPAIGGVGIVIIAGIKSVKCTPLRLESSRLVEAEQAETKLLLV